MGRVKRKNQKRSVSKDTRTSIPATTTEITPPASSRRKSATAAEFNPDYSYVITDLKTIGILAISFISLLVVLSFFLR
ncbi:MAG: hypothetical protein HPY76_07340 [Anaerolineae bacterium]|nr:hypothetical protein [Anaerolineae bacterium]